MNRSKSAAGERQPLATGRPRLRPLVVCLALGLSFAAGDDSRAASLQAAAYGAAWSDHRLHNLHAANRSDEAIALAREYGLEAFLPGTPETTVPASNCNDSGPGSLRDLLGAAADGDVVDLRGLPCSTITLTSGQIDIAVDSVSILGPGPNALVIRNGAGSTDASRVFSHTGTGTLLVQGVTVSDGALAGSTSASNALGGCIFSAGTVALGNPLFVGVPSLGAIVENCHAMADSVNVDDFARGGGVYAQQVILANSVVTGNSIGGAGSGIGGGIEAVQRLSMIFSEISGNVNAADTLSKYGGGGAHAGYQPGGYSLIENSTINGNISPVGGGLAFSGDAVIRSSTISGNTGAAAGGGLYSGGIGDVHVIVANSTITGNVVTSDHAGGGMATYASGQTGGGVDLESTIVAGNFRASNVPDDLAGTAVFSGANNLVGFAGPQTPVLPPGTLIGADPRLGPLANNGGRTRTHALLSGSPAIGIGNNNDNETTDQRGSGFPRVLGDHADIGAYEFDPDRIFANGFD